MLIFYVEGAHERTRQRKHSPLREWQRSSFLPSCHFSNRAVGWGNWYYVFFVYIGRSRANGRRSVS